uniref:ADAM10 endopeptidase n=1 Tax=Syphacia muris TaxID=451379 RepID=A0A0N5AAV0_9BILA
LFLFLFLLFLLLLFLLLLLTCNSHGLSKFLDGYQTLNYNPVSDAHSEVYGSLLDGIFDGHIHFSNGESFTVDKVGKYLPIQERKKDFHSIIYSDSEINHPKFRRKRSSEEHPGCGLTEEVRREMEKIQNSVITETDDDNSDSHQPYDRTCTLYIQTDQTLYRMIYNQEGNKDEVRTREEIVNIINSHLQALNSIYKNTDFNGINGINFSVQRISIFSPESCQKNISNRKKIEKNPYCDELIDVSNFLNLNSKMNHSDFCLAYVLTYRDFIGGTLGLAWVATPNQNSAGGICHQFSKCADASSFVYRSLNTGIITLINYGSRILPRVSQLTLAHEIGHNFGSPHDYPVDCQPGLPDGNFIMFSSATSGDKKNNAKFSRCSIANISLVLREVLKHPPFFSDSGRSMSFMYAGSSAKRNCFRPSKQSFCGNQLKEDGEECDCGYSREDCSIMQDRCCYPREAGDKGCRRKENSQCSISEGVCCQVDSCTFTPASEKKVCRRESDCLEEQICNGKNPICLPSAPKPNGTLCRDSTKVCHGGNCNGSLCAYLGMKDCFLTEGTPEQLCYLACEDANGTCRSSFELEIFASGRFNQSGRRNQPGLVLLPGSPCNNYKGYCDIFRKCRSVDADGPLARLKNVIFNPKTIEEVKSWIQVNWWAVVLCGLGLLLFMVIFIKCCAVHTPSTNPNKPPALSIYETLRRPQNFIYSQRRPHGVRRPNRNSNERSSAQSAGLQGNLVQIQHDSASQRPTRVVVVEPPPPYTVAADPGTSLGGPRRGHRKNKRKNEVELRVKSRRR